MWMILKKALWQDSDRSMLVDRYINYQEAIVALDFVGWTKEEMESFEEAHDCSGCVFYVSMEYVI